MTVSSITNKVSYNGNGSTTVFAYTFKTFDEDDLTVIIRSAAGTETTKTITTDYTVSGVGSEGGGNVTMLTAPAAGETITVLREQPLEQGLDLVPNDPFPASSLEDALDKLTFMVQAHSEELDRAVKASKTNTIGSTEFTVSAAVRANKIFGFDSAGELSVTQELGTYTGVWAAATSYSQRDIVKDSSNANIYICITAHTSSGVTPISGNADVAKWGLLVDAASATTSAAAAASSATDAETAQTAAEAAQTAAEAAQAAAEAAEAGTAADAATATTQAGIATTAATAAGVSETNAATSATNAATSASSAATSATSAGTSATAAATSASNASTSATSAATSATAAGASASNAATSATAAASSATAASGSATSAASSASSASGSASAASTSASNASTSATAAATSATAAATSAADAENRVPKTSDTGSAVVPTGTEAQRDVTPAAGYLRFNSEATSFEGYDGSAWGSIGGGATSDFMYENAATLAENITLAAGRNGMSTGPIDIPSGLSVTIESGSRWVVI